MDTQCIHIDLSQHPELWTVGHEYDFGGGLYGQRFQVTQTFTAINTTNVFTIISGNVKRIINAGGDFEYVSNVRLNFPYCDTANISTNGGIFSMPQVDQGDLKIYGKTNSASALTFKYDVWFLYEKTSS